MEKLTYIQKNLKAPKGQTNSFGKYKYRSCEDILEAVKPLLDGALLTLSDTVVLIGDRFYIKATATFTDGEFTQSNCAYAREEYDKKGMDASQITGTASSYARKYALNGLFLIDDTKDADTQAPTTDADKLQANKKRCNELYQQLSLDEQANIADFNSMTELADVQKIGLQMKKIIDSRGA